MNAKQKFLTVTAVWIIISMILSFIDLSYSLDSVASFIIVMLNRLLMLAVFIMLLIASPGETCRAASLLKRPAKTGVAAYIVGIVGAIVRFHINLQEIIHESVPEQAFAAVSGISALNLLYVVLCFFAYYRIGRRVRKGSLLRISAIVAAWWPLVSYLTITTVTITHLHQFFFGGAGSFLLISSYISTIISHLSIALCVLALRKELGSSRRED